jgi:tetratricopeptide (TPR) repeat protein
MRQRRFVALFCIVIASVSPTPLASADSPKPSASAPDEAAKRAASAHFHRGAELLQQGAYREALLELQRAYEIAPNYRVLFNVGQSHVALGEFVEGRRALQDFLEQGGKAIDAKRRTEVEAQIAELGLRTATLEIQVDRVGASVRVDGESVGTAPLPEVVPVNVGRHHIAAESADGASAAIEVDVAAGDRTLVPLALLIPTPVAVAPPTPAPPKERGWSARQKWAVGVLGSAAALAVAGGAVALISMSARDDYREQLRQIPGDPEAIDGARDQLFRRAITADVLFGTAAAAGVMGAVLLFVKRGATRDHKAAARPVDVALTPRAIVAMGRF